MPIRRTAPRRRRGPSQQDQNTIFIDHALRILNMTQAQLAERLGITQSAVSQMRVSRRPIKPVFQSMIHQMVIAEGASLAIRGNLRGATTEDDSCIRPVGESPAEFFVHLPHCRHCLIAAYDAVCGHVAYGME